MIKNKQKVIFAVMGIIAAFLSLIAVMPFQLLASKFGCEIKNLEGIELIVKLIVLPVVIALMCIYAGKVRTTNYYMQTKVSVAAIKMTYAPAVMYLVGLLAWICGAIYMKGAYKTSLLHGLALLLAVSGAFFIYVVFGLFTGWLKKLSNNGFKVINVLFTIMSLAVVGCVYIAYLKVSSAKVLPTSLTLFELCVCTVAFGLILLATWKAIYGNATTKVVLDKGETFSSEEVEYIIAGDVNEDLKVKFEEYYEKGKGTFVKAQKEVE